MRSVQNKYQRFFILTLCLYTFTLGVFVFWAMTRASGFNGAVLILQSLPLLILLPSMLSRHYRVFSWLCFIVLLYFIVAVMGVFSSTATLSDFVFLLSTVCLFIASMLCSRYAQRVQKNVQGTL